jgi:hypothetical protein
MHFNFHWHIVIVRIYRVQCGISIYVCHLSWSDQSNWHIDVGHLIDLLPLYLGTIQNLLFQLFWNIQLIAVNYKRNNIYWALWKVLTSQPYWIPRITFWNRVVVIIPMGSMGDFSSWIQGHRPGPPHRQGPRRLRSSPMFLLPFHSAIFFLVNLFI